MMKIEESKDIVAIDKFCLGLWGELTSVDVRLLLSSLMRPESIKSSVFGDDVELSFRADFMQVCNQLRTEGELIRLYKDALSTGRLSLPGFFSDEGSECYRSYHTNYGTFLEFVSGGEIFYLVQVRTSFDGFYFPRFNFFYGLGLGAVVSSVRDFIRSLLLGIRSSAVSRSEKPVKKLLGLWVGHQLPYHYFYDYLPGFQELFLSGLVKEWRPEVGLYTNGGYLRLEDFYPDIVRSRPVLHVKGCVYCPADGFFVSSLRSPSLRISKISPSLDEYVRARASYLFFNTSKGRLFERQFAGCKKIIWLGVMGGKRKWVEQIDCYKHIIGELASREKEIGVVFDGMTSSSYECLDYARLGGGVHDEIIRSVISCFSSFENIKFFSLNYSDPVEKLAVADRVDFFLSDAATSSMYVSRFCGVLGLVHSSSKIKGHLHRSVVEVPHEWVRSEGVGGWQFSDYSIDPILVADLFVGLCYSLSEKRL